ncbi:MAG: DUF433 domain-containing protein [Pirellulales bacterium]
MERTVISHIETRKNRAGQDRATISGTRVRVQDIYMDSEVRGKSPDEIVGSIPHLSLAQVHAALAYYFDNRQAILDEIRQDEDFVAKMRARTGPGPLEEKLKGTDAEDAVSSG